VRAQGLTPREEQIARLVADGLDNRQIANVLRCSLGTVKSHLVDIYYKLNIRDGSRRVKLTLWYSQC